MEATASCRSTSGATASGSGFRAPPKACGRLLSEARRPKTLRPESVSKPRAEDSTRGRFVVGAKRAADEDGGPRFEREDKSVRFTFRETEIKVPDQTLFLSGLALLGFGALIGPVIIGLAVTVVSISFAVSMGAFAISTLFFPLVIMSMLTFGFLSSLALLGIGVFAPKLIGLVAAGGGVAIVGFGLARLTQTQKKAAKETIKQEAAKSAVIDVDPEEEEAKRLSQELRDFDVLLADREFAKRMNQRKR